LGVAIAQQIEKDSTKPVAIVVLETEHYTHKSYGKVYTPAIEVLRFESMNVESAGKDEPAELEAPEVEEAPAPAPTTRRRRAV
jgi:hypothetical protein